MTDPEFRAARIVYVTDATRGDALVIPLGVFAEASTAEARGLALKARKALTADELSRIPAMLRSILQDPFAYFHGQFNEAWESAPPGKALEYLANRHSSNISVLLPKECDEKVWLISRLLHPSLDTLKAKLIAAVDREYAKLWDHKVAATDTEEVFIERKKAA